MNARKLYNIVLLNKKNLKWFLSRDRFEVQKNAIFKDIGKGKKCFILGNGPSLNEHDLSLIHDETVFCVNEFVRSNQINCVHPDYYVIADPKFFELDASIEEDKKFIEKIRNLSVVNSDVRLFAPISSKTVIERYHWNESLNISYFKNGLYFDEDFQKSIHLEKMIPSMQAVVQYAILIAIYMGFSEIYLLGTEQTNIFGNLKAFMSAENISDYAFSMTDKERAWKNKKLTECSLPGTLRGYARIFELYDQLYLYCQRQGVKIYNCAQETLIQSIPKANFESLFIDK